MKNHIMATLSDGKHFSCTIAACGFRTTSRKSHGYYFDWPTFRALAVSNPNDCCPACITRLETGYGGRYKLP